MMDKNTYKVFQYIIDNPKQDLHLNVTSNMCPPDKKVKEKYFNMAQEICMQEPSINFTPRKLLGQVIKGLSKKMNFKIYTEELEGEEQFLLMKNRRGVA